MGLNILVVDDSRVMRMVLVRTLRMSGLDLGEIIEAENGAVALKLVREHWLDLVMTDINMPVMDGERLIRALRENELTRDLPILVISTEGSDGRLSVLELQPLGFIRKPFTPEEIREKVIMMMGVAYGNGESGPCGLPGAGGDF